MFSPKKPTMWVFLVYIIISLIWLRFGHPQLGDFPYPSVD